MAVRGALALLALIIGVLPVLGCKGGAEPPSLTSGFPFPCLSTEGSAYHIHPYLQIRINGESVTIPRNIGISNNCFEPVHTHDSSGIVHIEANTNRNFSLGDFFAIWQATYKTVTIGGQTYPVDFDNAELVGHKVDSGHTTRLLVDQKLSDAGPGLVLNRLDYCSAAMRQLPYAPTAVGDPFPPAILDAYGVGHTIELEYGPQS